MTTTPLPTRTACRYGTGAPDAGPGARSFDGPLRGRLLGRRRRYVLRASTVEHVRVEVEPVGPDDRPQLRVDADLAEDGRVAERLAHRTPQIGGEVDDSLLPSSKIRRSL
jgi:hypothetical protein